MTKKVRAALIELPNDAGWVVHVHRSEIVHRFDNRAEAEAFAQEVGWGQRRTPSGPSTDASSLGSSVR